MCIMLLAVVHFSYLESSEMMLL